MLRNLSWSINLVPCCLFLPNFVFLCGIKEQRNEKQQAEAAAKFAEFLVYDMKFPNAEPEIKY